MVATHSLIRTVPLKDLSEQIAICTRIKIVWVSRVYYERNYGSSCIYIPATRYTALTQGSNEHHWLLATTIGINLQCFSSTCTLYFYKSALAVIIIITLKNIFLTYKVWIVTCSLQYSGGYLLVHTTSALSSSHLKIAISAPLHTPTKRKNERTAMVLLAKLLYITSVVLVPQCCMLHTMKLYEAH